MNLIKMKVKSIKSIKKIEEILINLDRTFQIEISEDEIIFFEKDSHKDSHSIAIVREERVVQWYHTYSVDEATFLDLKKYIESLTVVIGNK